MSTPDGYFCNFDSECAHNCCLSNYCEATTFCNSTTVFWWIYVIWVVASVISCIICVVIIVCIVRSCNRQA